MKVSKAMSIKIMIYWCKNSNVKKNVKEKVEKIVLYFEYSYLIPQGSKNTQLGFDLAFSCMPRKYFEGLYTLQKGDQWYKKC